MSRPRPEVVVAIEGGTPALRAGLAALLAGRESIRVSLDALSDEQPDVVLVVGAGASHRPGGDAPRIVLVENPADAATVIDGEGIAGVVLSDADAEQLTAAIGAAAAGLLVFTPGLRSLPGLGVTAGRGAAAGDLTAREIDVLSLIADGLANKAIALRLGISENTVKFHATAILGKLGTSSRAEAVMVAARRGLLAL